jgi:predicted TIM-barrel fold metal-dependent hydrolase
MIIDSHVHLMSSNFIAEPYWDEWVRLFSSLSNRPPDVVRRRLPEFWDETGELLLRDMDEAGIDQSWISVLDLGLAKPIGEPRYTVKELNEIYAQIAHDSDSRLIAFVGIDPRREEAVEILETGVKEWGMRGLKLIPAAGFYPNDDNCYKLYAKAEELVVPVLIHTGPEMTPLYSKYCYPIYLDEVANDFPNLTVILAHAGFCWWEEAVNLATTKPNILVDLAGWQPKTHRHPIEEFYLPLRKMIDAMGPSRILFGSDWPALRLFRGGQGTWVKTFTDPPDALDASGISFTTEEIESILGGNAVRIMEGR